MELNDNVFAQKFTDQLKRLENIRSTVANLAVATNLSAHNCFRLIDETSSQMVNTYPGEHYRWLSAYILSQKPLNVLELGTKNGLSLLSMVAAAGQLEDSHYLPKLTSVDILNVLNRRHFLPEEIINSNFITLVTGDATQIGTYKNIGFPLSDCDFVFIDTLHSGIQEAGILCALYEAGLKDDVIILADDINLNPEMSNWWKSLPFPKMELNLHFSGSGLCSFSRELISTSALLLQQSKTMVSVEDLNKQLVFAYFRKKLINYTQRFLRLENKS